MIRVKVDKEALEKACKEYAEKQKETKEEDEKWSNTT